MFFWILKRKTQLHLIVIHCIGNSKIHRLVIMNTIIYLPSNYRQNTFHKKGNDKTCKHVIWLSKIKLHGLLQTQYNKLKINMTITMINEEAMKKTKNNMNTWFKGALVHILNASLPYQRSLETYNILKNTDLILNQNFFPSLPCCTHFVLCVIYIFICHLQPSTNTSMLHI